MSQDKNQKHLQPLSKYAQRVLNAPVAHTSTHPFIQPPNHFKNVMTKVTTIDCGENRTASSKRPSCPQSPCCCCSDVGCLVESPSLRKDLVGCEGRPSVGVMDYADSPHTSTCGAQSVAQSFDLDVDDLLSLSPCGDRSQRVPDCEKNRKLQISSASLHQRKYGQHSAAPADDQGLYVTTVNHDAGYWGSYHTEYQPEPRNPSVLANQQPPHASWSQLHLDRRDVKEECLSESFQIAGAQPRQHSPALDSKVIMSGRPGSEWARSPIRGSVDDLWRVGLTMLREDVMESPLQVKARKTQSLVLFVACV